jgi:hypothetical protein
MQGAREPNSLPEENRWLQISYSHLVASVNVGIRRYQCINDIKVAFASCHVKGRPAVLNVADARHTDHAGSEGA